MMRAITRLTLPILIASFALCAYPLPGSSAAPEDSGALTHLNLTFHRLLSSRLQGASPADHVQACRETAEKLSRENSKKGTTVLRRSYEDALRQSQSNEERAILEEMLRSAAGKRMNTQRAEKLPAIKGAETVILPVILDNRLCLSCHGRVGTEVLPPVVSALADRYKGYTLVNKKVGDLIGFWIARKRVK